MTQRHSTRSTTPNDDASSRRNEGGSYSALRITGSPADRPACNPFAGLFKPYVYRAAERQRLARLP